jgi:hypothetical protein
MRASNPGDKKGFMAASGARPISREHVALPATFDTAVVRFDGLDDAAAAFDVLARGGQYSIVGKYTYLVTQRHVCLLNDAKIRYEVESVR